MKLTIVFEPDAESGFVASIPEVPGVFSQGETLEEAKEMVLSALKELSEYRREVAVQDLPEGAVLQEVELQVVELR